MTLKIGTTRRIIKVACVYEARKNTQKPAISPAAEKLEAITRRLMRSFHKVERSYGIKDFTKRYHYHLSPAMEAWIDGASFEEMIAKTDVDEGELVRYFRMCIQILHEITQAPVSHILRDRIFQLIYKIRRDVIDSEKQLRS